MNARIKTENADLHVHTRYSDGADDVESTILSAEKKGLKTVGISDHSYTYFDTSYCMQKENIGRYIAEINALKQKYAGRINVFCGVEYDLFSDIDLNGYDYAIGSSHYFKKGDRFYPVDENLETYLKIVGELFGGDYYAACEEYFRNVALFADMDKVKIIGHFDLIAKYNGKGEYFDENGERYIKAYTSAIDRIVKAGKVFEINTGALRKGLRADAYPAENIRRAIKAAGGKFIISSDSHRKEDLAFGFDRYKNEPLAGEI